VHRHLHGPPLLNLTKKLAGPLPQLTHADGLHVLQSSTATRVADGIPLGTEPASDIGGKFDFPGSYGPAGGLAWRTILTTLSSKERDGTEDTCE
jgi:hypothetical protein